ncbi:peptide MFS transporter [Phenylobacterium aquaticum]|uniref:peptide MFS transporter n=1 Tax=Phenylobacterium aquaticum TaxID=1763816 RepID=UPI001F5C1CDA|nr:peptide MFS transporter [Phenylobacterium aquaticum]MCI3131178.1 peptide MFS transporter [Phenylobacterium aquaticum]
MTISASATGPDRAARDWFGHPRGLTILFLTQMWECFSFFGMRALLVYYMIRELGFTQQKASLIYGAYTALIFLTPMAGGALSDRWLGRRKAVTLGATIMALGHFMMASQPLFYPALITIALGSGLFTPSLPSQIRELYAPEDPRRLGSYNVYYVGVNTGGFLAPLICGALGETFGWHWGFGAAGVGMAVGLAIYLLGGRWLPEEPKTGPRRDRAAAVDPAPGRWRLLAATGFAVVLFRGAYEQMGNTIAVWAATGVDRGVLGHAIPMTWFQAMNPLFIVLLTPLVLAYWRRHTARRSEMPPLFRMAIGGGIVAAAYLILSAVAALSPAGSASWAWLVLFIAIVTLGELWILPVGLGLFGRLAPAGMAATMIAAWYLAGFAGNILAGVIGALLTDLGPAPFFSLMAAVAASAGAALFVLNRRFGALAAHDPEAGADR